jgi:hypothetical protein
MEYVRAFVRAAGVLTWRGPDQAVIDKVIDKREWRGIRARRVGALAVAAIVAATAPAMAFDTSKLGYGSLFVGDFMPLIDSSPKLKQEVDAALAAAGKKPDQQLCESPRFPGPWRHLHGEHVAPFVCNIGAKWLQIDAVVKVTGPKGEVYETDAPAALKRASRISQTRPTWTWTDADPRAAK